MDLRDQITVVIPTSPIPSHPSTAILDETIASVRSHLPNSPIMIQVDGLRPEQEGFRKEYSEYVNKILNRAVYKTSFEVFQDFQHQASMMKKTINNIITPLMIYVEHDTPLCEEKEIDWNGIVEVVRSQTLHSVRLHHYDLGWIHPEHDYLMLDRERLYYEPAHLPVIRTVQWSQRAHVTTVDFYRRLLSYFSDESRTMIEDHFYNVVTQEVSWRGKQAAWDMWRLAIYAPEGHIKRSRDLNGRDGGPKFEETFRA